MAVRSERQGAPALIWPVFRPTARSAMVVSSVSPERWLTTAVQPACCAILMAAMVSVRVPIWLSLMRMELEAFRLDALAQALDVGDVEVVADELDFVAQLFGKQLPAVPVVLGHAVLDADDGVGRDPLDIIVHHLGGAEGDAFLGQDVFAVLIELAGGRVQGDKAVLARFVAGLLDGGDR